MKSTLAQFRERIATSVWLIPIGFSLMSVALALTMLSLDRLAPTPGSIVPSPAIPVASARQLFGVIAGSIIGVGGVAFSITMVAMTLTSGQYGPKILRHFLEDSESKFSLGLFLGTYLYALVTLSAYRPDDEPFFVVIGILLMTFLALVGFVRFIHRTATDLQADKIIERIGGQLSASFARLARADGDSSRRETATRAWRRRSRTRPATPVNTRRSGYIRSIDYPALVEWAQRHDCTVQVRVRAGDFVLARTCILRVHRDAGEPSESKCEALEDAFLVGPTRTPMQDPEYAITQLIQLAARALSPGINDPGTAITCIDWISLALASIVDQDLPGGVIVDDTGTPRLLVRRHDFDGILKAIYTPLRQLAAKDASVRMRLIESLSRLAQLTGRPERLRAMAAHGELIRDQVLGDDLAVPDRIDFERRYNKLMTLTASRVDDSNRS